MMQARFIGTSYGAPSPGRHQQSILIETEKGAYLFDAGAPVLDILVNEGYDLAKIRAIFLSHSHGDHINGIFDLLYLAGYFGMRYELYLPSKPCEALVNTYLSLQGIRQGESISLREIGEGVFFDDGVISIRAFCTGHTDKIENPTFGFLIEGEGKSVYISSDLHASLSDLPPFLKAREIDLAVVECAHFGASDLVSHIEAWCARQCAVVHVMPAEKYEDLIALARTSPKKILLPSDTDVIRL